MQPRFKGPFPSLHRVLPFLDSGEHDALLDWAIAHEGEFSPSRLKGGVLDPKRRISVKTNRLDHFADLLRARISARLPEIFAGTGVKPFPVDFIELELAAHGDGAHFAAHTDIPIGADAGALGGDNSGRHDRLISAVYYLHREPPGFTGGALRVHRFGGSGDAEDVVDVAPERNSLVAFPSWATHEVRPVSCPSGRFEDHRFAVNCWICRLRP